MPIFPKRDACFAWFARCVLLCLCAFFAAGCAGRGLPEDSGLKAYPRLAHMKDVDDLRRLPQDLTVYARNAGWEKELLPAGGQEQQKARFERIFFGPWSRGVPAAPVADLAARFGKGPKGFTSEGLPWTQGDWERMRANAALASYPSLSQPGITVRAADLRELPTPGARMTKPLPVGPDNPFDMIQYSALPLGTPLHIAHASADGFWYFVQTPVASGWIPTEDAAFADAAFREKYRGGRYATPVRDAFPVETRYGVSGLMTIGAIYPLVSEGSKYVRVLVPVRGVQGQALAAVARLEAKQMKPWPLPFVPAWVAAVGNQMLGQPYGWGGMYEGRDCSAALRDLFAPFGVWLPRNSAAQARVGSFTPLESLDGADKERVIAAQGRPFMSLLWMSGHIMLYLGQYKGESVVFHNVWGLRTAENGDDDGRWVIGRGVVSSLRLGVELPTLKDGTTLLERLKGMATLR